MKSISVSLLFFAVAVATVITTVFTDAVSYTTIKDEKVPIVNWMMFSSKLPKTRYNFKAPGTVFGNLVDDKIGIPENILDGMQLKNVNSEPFKCPWVFNFRSGDFPSAFFPNSSSSPSSSISYNYHLRFEGINYKANLTVNGITIVTQTTFVGTFREFTFDITNAVVNQTSGKPINDLKIELIMVPPVDDVFPPINPSTDLARTWIDWAPPPPDASMGLWRNVYLIRQETKVWSPWEKSKTEQQKMEKKNPIFNQLSHHQHQYQKEKSSSTKTNQQQAPAPCFGGELRFPQIRIKIPSEYEWQDTPPYAYNNVEIEVDAVFDFPENVELPSSPSSQQNLYDYSFECSIYRQSSLNHPSPTINLKNSNFISSVTSNRRMTLTANQYANGTAGPVKSTLYVTDLWYPWQMASQDGYQSFNIRAGNGEPLITSPKFVNLTCTLRERYSSTFCASSVQNVSIGLRQSDSRIVRLPDTQPVRRFYVNKIPILIRGAGWAPELFYRDTIQDYNTTFTYIRTMNLNAVRLEGKFPDDSFFHMADMTGVMVLPGFSCCDAFQHWSNWTDETFVVANETLRFQLRRLRRFASVSTFFYSSDELPPEAVEKMYLQTFENEKWPNVKISSAANVTSNLSSYSGVKMSGPYSIVPESYWSIGADKKLLGGAFGFLTEGGPGESPVTFLSQLAMTVDKNKVGATNASQLYPAQTSELVNYHMGNPAGLFYNLRFYNPYMNDRYVLDETLTPYQFAEYAQLLNYQSQQAYQDAYNGNKYNATGYVQWMLNSAWPSNLWNLYSHDYSTGGAFYGTRTTNSFTFVGDGVSSLDNSAIVPWFDWAKNSVSVFNGGYNSQIFEADISVEIYVLSAIGENISNPESKVSFDMFFYSSAFATIPQPKPDAVFRDILSSPANFSLPPQNKNANSGTNRKSVTLIRLLSDRPNFVDKLYWRSNVQDDILEWNQSNFYRTPTSQAADYRPIAQAIVDHQNSKEILEQVRLVNVTACFERDNLVRVTVIRNWGEEEVSSFSHRRTNKRHHHLGKREKSSKENTTSRTQQQQQQYHSKSFLLMAHFTLVHIHPKSGQVNEIKPMIWTDNFISMFPTLNDYDLKRTLYGRVLEQGMENMMMMKDIDRKDLFINLRNISYSIKPVCTGPQ